MQRQRGGGLAVREKPETIIMVSSSVRWLPSLNAQLKREATCLMAPGSLKQRAYSQHSPTGTV